MLLHHPADGPEHVVHRLAEVFAAVRRQQDQAAVRGPLELRMRIVLPDGGLQRVDDGIARYIYGFRLLAFPDQVFPAQRSRREMVAGHDTRRLPVEFLGIRGERVICAEPRLHMADGNLHIVAGQRRGKGRAGIPVHQHHIRLFLLQDLPHAGHHVDGDVKQRLPVLHDRQVVLRHHLERVQYLLQHAPVLSGHADDGLDSVPFPEFLHQRAHLDRFRPGAEHQHDLFAPGTVPFIRHTASSVTSDISCSG